MYRYVSRETKSPDSHYSVHLRFIALVQITAFLPLFDWRHQSVQTVRRVPLSVAAPCVTRVTSSTTTAPVPVSSQRNIHYMNVIACEKFSHPTHTLWGALKSITSNDTQNENHIDLL